MSNQMEDGWYPECDDCGCGNLVESHTYCGDCFKKLKKTIKKEALDEVKTKIRLTKYGSSIIRRHGRKSGLNVVAVICARGGSKGLPGKNIKKLLGKPLIAYTIETAKECDLIDRVIVSTDDKEIAKIAKRYGAEVPFLRPKELSGDKIAVAPAVQHAIKYLEQTEGYKTDIIVLPDVTSPLRTAEDLTRSIAELINQNADASMTVCETHHNPYFNMVEYKDKKYVGLIIKLKKRPSCRQKAPKVFWANSAAFVVKAKKFIKEGSFFPKKTIPIIMPEERSFHIDTPFDFRLVEMIMRGKLK